MKIPSNYDKDASEYGERLAPGGHKCVIKQAEETISKSGREMLVISFDTTEEDLQPKHFMNRYIADQREDKKWSGNSYIVLDGEYAASNINRFLGAVENSNENFHPQKGGELDPAVFKGLKVGIVFREEEYNNYAGEVRTSVKPFRWCSYDKAFDQEIPLPKLLQSSAASLQATSTLQKAQAPSAGFFDVPADALEDEGLPFK